MANSLRVLVTGGSGTLGYAIATYAQRESLSWDITVFSRSEQRQAIMRRRFPDLKYVLGDVRDYDSVNAAVRGHGLVIHAAAMKIVPQCDIEPEECFKTNVLGSMNVIRACFNNDVERCLGISTDKACRAISAFGASKLAMEKLFSATPNGATIFTTVRYGNVTQSRGSVIPIWRQQVRQRQSITITNPDMTRFWLSPFDTTRIIIDGIKQPHGTILVSKPGALSISQLANIIAPGAEVKIIGMRQVEKFHEDLIHTDEPTLNLGDYFRVGVGGKIGLRYSSDIAQRLTANEFLKMLSDAESLE
jgi:UDP-N-acetylglucosamine 4,6-dehydratase